MNELIKSVASELGVDQNTLHEVLSKSILPTGTKQEHLVAFLTIAKQFKLNPVTKEIWAFPDNKGGITTSISVDGYIKIMNNHPQFERIEFGREADDKGKVISATARIYRKDRTHPTEVTEYLSDCYNERSPAWKNYPNRMLRQAAMKQAIRLAFGLSGITPEPDAQEEEPPAPKVINPEGSQTFFLLKEQFESCQSQEALEEANSLANAYAKRGDLKKGEVDRLKLIQKQVEQEIAQTMATATEAA
jgi:hypothetical protein